MPKQLALGCETFRGVVHPWHCDVIGHMNVRHYMGMFDDAAFQLLGMLAGGSHTLDEQGLGWADVQHTVQYKHEVRPGSLVVVRSRVTRVGRTSVTVSHDMMGALAGELFASMEAVTVLFDLKARSAAPLPAAIRQRAEELQLAQP